MGSIIPARPFQLRIFCDSTIHVNAQAACSDLPTSGQHSLQHQDTGNATFHSRDTPACSGTWTSTVNSLLQRLLYRKEHCQLKLLRLFFFFLNQFTMQNTNITLISCYFVPSPTHPLLGRQVQAGRAEQSCSLTPINLV